MTDHIGEATQKVIDLDALEKQLRGAADDFAEHATPIEGDGQTATLLRETADVIAELKEARGLLEEVADELKAEIDARYDGMLPQLEARYARDLSTVSAARAFLARNGKGEG